MHALRGLAAACALVALLPVPGEGQGRGCEILQMRKYSQTTIGGQEIVYIQGPVHLLCDGGVTIRADSATSYQARREMDLIGNVFYSDAEKSIAADRVRRYGLDGRLVARGSVVVRGRETGAVIRGPDLVHREAREGSPAHTEVTGRPHATLPPETPATGTRPDTLRADTLEIDSDRMEMLGETLFYAFGDVVFERGETRGSSRDATFDQAAGTVRLHGAGRIWGDAFELRGDTVLASLRDDELRQVTAWPGATLEARDIQVESPELRIFIRDGELERMVAIADPGAGEADRARATAREFLLVADSIDAMVPAQRLERVIAVGRAYGRRRAERVDLTLPELVRHDWLRGDTIIGEFTTREAVADADGPAAAHPVAASSPEAVDEEAVLERLIAIAGGVPARSLFRMADEEADGGAADVAGTRKPVNYLVASRITVLFDDGEVGEVNAEGEIRGLHLQPTQASSPAEERTAAGSVPR